MPEGRERTPAPRMFLTGGRGIERGREGETIGVRWNGLQILG